MRDLMSVYNPKFLRDVVYILQQSEYRARIYLKWLWGTQSFKKVQHRGSLDLTLPAKLMLAATYILAIGVVVSAAYIAYLAFWQWENDVAGVLAIFSLVAWPIVAAHLVILPMWFGRVFIINPVTMRRNRIASQKFSRTKATKIAVAGSFGKTTMKEVLATVLSEARNVAYTEGNLNTAVAHAWFVEALSGDEEVLIVEYGEYRPGDISEFNEVVQPDIGILTGLNEAHLENFGSLDKSAENLFSLAAYVGSENIYLNADSDKLMRYEPSGTAYNTKQVDGWKISDVEISALQTKFKMKKSRRTINVESGLVGRHNVATLALAAVIAHRLGLDKKQIESGLKNTHSFEHRLSTEVRNDGTIVIDDTYNGNIDGVKVGVAFLDEIEAKRKVYVTPGLVEQGGATKSVHVELGETVASIADVVVLMENSVTDFIVEGLNKAGFKGELLTINDPLKFYNNLNQFSAAGDAILMQNDWTDIYE